MQKAIASRARYRSRWSRDQPLSPKRIKQVYAMNDIKQSHDRFEKHLKSLVLNGPFDGIEHKSHATQCLNHWGDTKHGTENFRLLQERRRAEAKSTGGNCTSGNRSDSSSAS